MNVRSAVCCLGLCAACLVPLGAEAQPKRPVPRKTTVNPAAVRALDMEADQLHKEFVDSLEDVANRYEEAGDLEKAEATLSQVLKLDPDRDEVKERLDTMKARVFEENEVEVNVDVTRGWITSGVMVKKGESVRLAAEGAYKLILNATVSPNGVDTADLNRDMVDGVTLGELMGVIFPPPKGREKPKPGKPFSIGTGKEFSPDESGMLFLRLNVPVGTKSIGSVKVKISGNIER